MKIENKIKLVILLAGCLVFLFVSQPVSAGMWDDWENWEDWAPTPFGVGVHDATSTTIINEIKVSTNTGGNTAVSGEVKQGEEKVEVEIKSIVNDKEIEPIEIKTEGGKVEVKSRIEVRDNEEPKVEQEVVIDGKSPIRNKISNGINFWEKFRSFFRSLFKIW